MFSRSVLFSSSLLLLVACSGESFRDESVSSSAGAAGVSGGQTSAGQAGSGGGQENPGGNAGTGGIAGQSGSGGTEESGGGGIAQGGNGGNSAGEGGDGGQAGSGGSGIPCGQQKFSCSGDVLFACENGVLVEKKTCGSGLCDSIKGDCLTCVVDQAIECFNETTVLTCDASGTGKVLVSCTGETPFCSQGQCVSCVKDTDCKEELDCYKASCGGGVCLQEPLLEGIVAKAQTPNDCQKNVCDGKGSTKSIPDTEDLPVASSACVFGVCDESGAPGEAPVAVGASCGDAGVCNGKGACGVCVPGEIACDGTGSIHSCQEDGNWGKTEKCPTATPACSAGACVGVTQLASGEAHSCALLTDGTVRCWGNNWVGQIGVGQGNSTFTKPILVPGLSSVVQITSGDYHSCALLKNGSIWCWGTNFDGSLGSQDATNASFTPLQINSESSFVQVDAGQRHTCAISDKKLVFCWGSNKRGVSGQPENELNVKSPKIVNGVSSVVKIAAGSAHSCAINSDHDMFCWGSNGGFGSPLGDTFENVPQLISSISKFVENTVSGDNHIFVTRKSEDPNKKLDIWVWGDGYCHQNFENGFSTYEPKILSYGNAAQISSVFAGFDNSVLLTSSGIAWVIGDNQYGQLGIGKKDDLWGAGTLPLSGVVEVVPGGTHMCARQQTGTIWCWGDGSQGQLGNGDTSEHLTPVEVVWLHSGNPLDESSVTLEVVLHACH